MQPDDDGPAVSGMRRKERLFHPRELQGVSILEGVALESVWGILSHCPVEELGPGQVLISPAQTERTLFVLLAGRLSVHLDAPAELEGRGSLPSRPSDAGSPALGHPGAGPFGVSVAELLPGQAVGEISVLEARPATAWVVSATEVRVLAIEESMFWRLIQASHEFSINLLLLLARRMRDNNQRLTASVAQQRVLEREVTTDALTGLFNRRWLDQRLERFVSRHRRGKLPLSVLMLDVDHFKRVNDRYGHAAGDAVLAFVARTLLASLRPTDMSARYGGEELAVVLPDTDLAGARIAAERLRIAIHTAEPPHDPKERLSVSIGVATLEDADDAASLLARADGLLYRAKASGRNRVESGGE